MTPILPYVPLNFIWPVMLWGLLALPVLIVAYLWLLRRRKQSTLRFANLGLVREALGRARCLAAPSCRRCCCCWRWPCCCWRRPGRPR